MRDDDIDVEFKCSPCVVAITRYGKAQICVISCETIGAK